MSGKVLKSWKLFLWWLNASGPESAWDYPGVSGLYVSRFREQLKEVAKALGPNVCTRFNIRLSCAELCDEWGTLARVIVTGYINPKEAMVTTRFPLPAEAQRVIRRAFTTLEHGTRFTTDPPQAVA